MNGVIRISGEIAGMGFDLSEIKRSYDGGEGYGPWPLDAAKTGTLTTRTGDDGGDITFEESHGFIVGDKLDLYWASGRRYWVDVTVVVDNLVTIATHGAPAKDGGDVLPAQGTAMTGCERVVKAIDFDGDDVVMLLAQSKKRGHIHFVDTAEDNIHPQELKAGEAWPWVKTWVYANPITGNAATALHISNGEAVASEIRVAVLKGSAL